MKNKLLQNWKINKADLWWGIAVMAALFFMLFIYAPTEMYSYNRDEFWYDYAKLFPVILVIFLGAFLSAVLGITVVCLLFPSLYRRLLFPFSCIVFLSTYVQGNFFVGNLPPMDGSQPDWSEYGTEMRQSMLIWLVVTLLVVLGCVLLKQKFVKIAGMVSTGMLLMLFVTMLSVLFTTGGYRGKMDACATSKDEYTFSENENFIVLVLDSVDAGTLSDMMENNPEYKTIFEDFTYYENMQGAYSCTEIAIPQILSGVWYENERPVVEYEVESYNNSPILAAAEQAGYVMGMYEYEMPYEDENIYRFNNVLARNSIINNYVEFAKLQIKLVGYRYAPFQIKDRCLFNTTGLAAFWETNDEYTVYLAENKHFYDRVLASEITTVPEKHFKFIHIDGAHVPFCYDENVNRIDSKDGTYRKSVAATLTITRAYLEKLKAAGVYDNSAIVIMADHGFDENYTFVEGIKACENRQNPVFFVKAAGEKHDMRVSQAPVSYDDLQEAFSRLLRGADGDEIFDYSEGEQRTRRYIYYDFVEDEYMYEYMNEGHASDDGAMQFTGNEYIRK